MQYLAKLKLENNMRSKKEFYDLVRNLRKILKDPANLKCSCPKIKCEWHGKCRECVALHLYNKDHLPNCFQIVFNDKIKSMASIGELNTMEKAKTPPEYWEYVSEQDQLHKS